MDFSPKRLLVCAAALLVAFGWSALGHAETLRVNGVYPAGSDRAVHVRTIEIERFGGVDGPALSIRIDDALRAVAIGGEPWFDIRAAGFARRSDAVLRGTAAAEVVRSRYTERREKCLARDDAGKCIERAKVPVSCQRRTVSLDASVRLIAASGELLYSDDTPQSEQATHCEDASGDLPTVETVVRGLAAKIVARVRRDLAPEERSEGIRVLENRKGLGKDLQARFQQAVRMTKRDPVGACREWNLIDAAQPAHAPTVFNVGLCHESSGQLDAAEKQYRLVLSLSPRDSSAEAGLRRIDARRRAERQIAAHDG